MKTNYFDLLLHEIGGLIVSCSNCQPYEGGEPVWMDAPVCLDDLFDRYDLPELQRVRLARRLRCRVCTARFEQYSIVGIELVPEPISAQRQQAA
ncbi:MAG: hypothetical protein M3R15_29055 [Acidobacteriota bacterium]|nr:hypothetical protein [Acidobacteriota bacterium]